MTSIAAVGLRSGIGGSLLWLCRRYRRAIMRFQTPLVPARLVRRYKRFLADVVLESDGRAVTAHCPNPGAMLGLNAPGARVWLEPNDDPKRKLRFGWRLVELPGGHMAGIDTGVPNRIVAEALGARAIPALAAYGGVRPEVRYATRSRVDFLLTEPGLPDCYVEVTARGARHLRDLADMVAQGHRAAMLYVVQRTDCGRLRMAADLDPAYAAGFDAARAAGVEMLCHGTVITEGGVELSGPLTIA